MTRTSGQTCSITAFDPIGLPDLPKFDAAEQSSSFAILDFVIQIPVILIVQISISTDCSILSQFQSRIILKIQLTCTFNMMQPQASIEQRQRAKLVWTFNVLHACLLEVH